MPSKYFRGSHEPHLSPYLIPSWSLPSICMQPALCDTFRLFRHRANLLFAKGSWGLLVAIVAHLSSLLFRIRLVSAIPISSVVVSSPLRACVNTLPIFVVVHVVSFDVRAARFARVTSPTLYIACSNPLYDSLGLTTSSCGSSRLFPLQQRHHLATQPLLYCKIKKSPNARATLTSPSHVCLSSLGFISLCLIYSPPSRNMYPR